MSNRQIQPVRNRDMIIHQARPRSVWGQVWNVALQPNNFFLALPQAPSSSRQWFWVALLILALNGFSAVRQAALATGGDSSSAAPITQNSPSDFSSNPGGNFPSSPGGGIPSQVGGGDPSTSVPSDPSAGGTSDITSTWVTALISASTILVGWFVLAVILCEVPLFNGVRPSFSQNLQIAIWTTVPLGIMAGLQVIYLAAGGKGGSDGISGLLLYWKGYNDLPLMARSIVLSLTSRLTIFWVWTLILIYIGGRQALNGKSWAVALVVVVWVLILVLMPVVTGAIAAPVVPNDLPATITLPSDNGAVPEVTQSAGDLLPTVEPDNSVLPTVEGGDISTPQGDIVPTAETNTDTNATGANVLPTIEPEQPSPTPS